MLPIVHTCRLKRVPIRVMMERGDVRLDVGQVVLNLLDVMVLLSNRKQVGSRLSFKYIRDLVQVEKKTVIPHLGTPGCIFPLMEFI